MRIDHRLYLAFLTACLVGIGAGVLWYLGGDNGYHAVVKGVFSGGGAFTFVLLLLGGISRNDCSKDHHKRECGDASE